MEEYFTEFANNQQANFQSVNEHLASMDDEIRRTIDRRRKRTPKELDYEDVIVLKSDP